MVVAQIILDMDSGRAGAIVKPHKPFGATGQRSPIARGSRSLCEGGASQTSLWYSSRWMEWKGGWE